MALKMRVYAELTEMNPKPLLGMTWRQLAFSAVTLVVGGGISVGFYLLGWMDSIAYVMALIAIPLGALGWLKPMGLNFETYAAHIWRSYRIGRLTYRNLPVWASHHTDSYEGKKHVSPRTRSRRNTDPLTEAGN